MYHGDGVGWKGGGCQQLCILVESSWIANRLCSVSFRRRFGHNSSSFTHLNFGALGFRVWGLGFWVLVLVLGAKVLGA